MTTIKEETGLNCWKGLEIRKNFITTGEGEVRPQSGYNASVSICHTVLRFIKFCHFVSQSDQNVLSLKACDLRSMSLQPTIFLFSCL